jgi:hypothetical protein
MPGCAVPALQTVVLHEGLLHRVQRAVGGSAIPSIVRTSCAVGLHGEHRAALDRLAVQVQRTGAARRRVAADVGARQPDVLRGCTAPAASAVRRRACASVPLTVTVISTGGPPWIPFAGGWTTPACRSRTPIMHHWPTPRRHSDCHRRPTRRIPSKNRVGFALSAIEPRDFGWGRGWVRAGRRCRTDREVASRKAMITVAEDRVVPALGVVRPPEAAEAVHDRHHRERTDHEADRRSDSRGRCRRRAARTGTRCTSRRHRQVLMTATSGTPSGPRRRWRCAPRAGGADAA